VAIRGHLTVVDNRCSIHGNAEKRGREEKEGMGLLKRAAGEMTRTNNSTGAL
jgi:hypothetical protein